MQISFFYFYQVVFNQRKVTYFSLVKFAFATPQISTKISVASEYILLYRKLHKAAAGALWQIEQAISDDEVKESDETQKHDDDDCEYDENSEEQNKYENQEYEYEDLEYCVTVCYTCLVEIQRNKLFGN